MDVFVRLLETQEILRKSLRKDDSVLVKDKGHDKSHRKNSYGISTTSSSEVNVAPTEPKP